MQVKVVGKINEHLKAVFITGNKQIEVCSDSVLSTAQNMGLNKETLIKLNANIKRLEALQDAYWHMTDDHNYWKTQRDLRIKIDSLKNLKKEVTKNEN